MLDNAVLAIFLGTNEDLHDILDVERLLQSKWGWKLTPSLITKDWSQLIIVDTSIEIIKDVEEMLESSRARLEVTKRKCRRRDWTCGHRTNLRMLRKRTQP